MCVCECVEASLLYIVVFINLRPANREAAVNPCSVKTRCESRGGSNLRTESHRRTHTHTPTHALSQAHTQRRTGGFCLWRCLVFYSIFSLRYCFEEAFLKTRLRRRRHSLSRFHPLSSKNSSGSLVRDCAAPSPPLFSPQPSHSVDGHPRSVRSSCPPVMPRSRVGGSACCLGIRCDAWTPSWERASPSTAAETSPRCPCSPGRSSR